MSGIQDITSQARTWLGTPFFHQARVKNKGCDCLGLIMGVAQELGLKDKHGKLFASHDEVTYPRQPSGTYVADKLSSVLNEVPIDQAQSGDLGLFSIAGNPQHLAILTDFGDGLGLIHCDARSGRVVEHRLDQDWRSRLFRIYRWQQQDCL